MSNEIFSQGVAERMQEWLVLGVDWSRCRTEAVAFHRHQCN